MPTEEEFIKSLIDPEEGIVPVEIDVEQIEKDARGYACSLVDNLSKYYFNEEFMSTHPIFKKRVDSDLDSLCMLLKMRAIDVATQDGLLKSISGNSSNASLYKSLTELQKTILSIQSKIDDTIKSLETFMKGYQLEIDFTKDVNQEMQYDSSDDAIEEMTTRGSKDFITKMREGSN